MTESTESSMQSAGADVDITDRIDSIRVDTEYAGKYHSINRIRDLPDFHIDEPRNLGGSNSGPTALETTLAALNSCTAMIVHIMRMEMGFDLQGMRFETDGYIDVRRVEMKRTGKKYSEVQPIAEHYHEVHQRVYITTPESEERLQHMAHEVERLCPLHALFRGARVKMRTDWIRQPPA